MKVEIPPNRCGWKQTYLQPFINHRSTARVNAFSTMSLRGARTAPAFVTEAHPGGRLSCELSTTGGLKGKSGGPTLQVFDNYVHQRRF